MSRFARQAPTSLAFLFLIGLLCLGVFLQILGVPVTFWDLSDSDDPFTASVQSGFAVLPGEWLLTPFFYCLLACPGVGPSYQHLHQYRLFRPPLPSF